MKVNPNYLGRLFTENELTKEKRFSWRRMLMMRRGNFRQRCNSIIPEEWYFALSVLTYCRECLLMKDRVTKLYTISTGYFPKQDVLKWRNN